MNVGELLRKAGIRQVGAPSQLESEVVEYDPKTGEPTVMVVDGQVFPYSDDALRRAALTFLKGLGINVDGERKFTEQVVRYDDPMRIGGLPEKKKRRK